MQLLIYASYTVLSCLVFIFFGISEKIRRTHLILKMQLLIYASYTVLYDPVSFLFFSEFFGENTTKNTLLFNTKNSKCAFQKYLNIFKKCGETKFHNIFNRLGTPFSTKLPYCCQRRYRVGNRTNRTCYLV